MGFIFSKPVGYVRGKIDNTKNSIKDTTACVHNKIVETKNTVVNGIVGVKNGVVQRVSNTVNVICSCCGAVIQRFCAAKDALVNGICTACQAVKNVFLAIHQKYTNTKNAITGTFTACRDKITGTYHRIRNTKLSKKQKFFYGLLFILFLIVFIYSSMILWDVYDGDYDAAMAKVDDALVVGQEIMDYLHYVFLNVWSVLQVSGGHIWEGTKTSGNHAWEKGKVCSVYAWEATKVGAEYGLETATVLAANALEGLMVVADYGYVTGKLAGKHIWAGSKVAAEHAAYGISVGSAHAFNATKVFTYNLAVATYHGSFVAMEKAKVLTWGVMTGSISGTQVLMDGSKLIANKTYYGSIASAEFTQNAAITLYEWACVTAAFIYDWSVFGGTNFYEGASKTISVTSEWSVSTATALFSGGTSAANVTWEWISTYSVEGYYYICTAVDFVVNAIITISIFIWEWTYFLTTEGTTKLYDFMNKFGLRWLYAIGSKLIDWGTVIFSILWNFIRDLSIILYNAFSVIGYQVYCVVYIVLAFVINTIDAVMKIVKIGIKGIVTCITFIFSSIIWALQECMFGYMYVLHKYNMYREMLFVIFIIMMSSYCFGLIRDRQEIQEEEEEEEEEESDIGPPEDVGSVVHRKPTELPPIYEERPEVPAYSNDDDYESGPAAMPDAFDSSDDEILEEFTSAIVKEAPKPKSVRKKSAELVQASLNMSKKKKVPTATLR